MFLTKILAAVLTLAVAGGILIAWDVLQRDAWTQTQRGNELGHWTGERRFTPTQLHLDYGTDL